MTPDGLLATAGQLAAASSAPEAPLKLAAPRKLHLGHFAFMRALVQGLDTRIAWQRYLRIEGEHSDLRTVRKTIAWLRDEFAASARRWQRHGAARLVLVDLASMTDAAPALPSLEAFVAERGLDGFAEAEQLAAYEAEHGNAGQRTNRRARLIGRQLDTLRWLEGLVAEPPRAGDEVGAWLHPDLATRLECAGLGTIAAVIDRINGLGSVWYRDLRGFGATKAARVVDWLRAHEATIGMAIGTHTLVRKATLSPARLQAVVPRATGIVPLEKLIVPAALSGSNGLYRLPQELCLLRATNDYEAILAWIRAKQGTSTAAQAAKRRRTGAEPAVPGGPVAGLGALSHTQRAYLKEAERFLLWAVVQRQKPLSSMMLEDCTAYRDFLADPQPVATWCGPRARARWSPLWRPFEGPLSPSAQRRAIAILKSLYRFLVDQCYLRGNPFAGLALPRANQGMDIGRSFTDAQWAFIREQLGALPDHSANQRLKFALALLYATGLRISEAVAARVADLARQTYRDDASGAVIDVWELTVVGKGGKVRTVAVSPAIVAQLQSYLASRGLSPDLGALPGAAYLLGRAVDAAERASWSPAARAPLDRLAGIGTATLHDQIKAFFIACAGKLQAADPAGAQRLAKASAHWMRHTHGSHAVAAGMDIKVVQQNLGHASLATTTRYTTSEARRRATETAKLWNAQATGGAKPPMD
jgi:site-specific recombinase XerD